MDIESIITALKEMIRDEFIAAAEVVNNQIIVRFSNGTERKITVE